MSSVIDLLKAHGAQNDQASERANVVSVAGALRGANSWRELKQPANQCSPKLQLVLPSELQEVINERVKHQETPEKQQTCLSPCSR